MINNFTIFLFPQKDLESQEYVKVIRFHRSLIITELTMLSQEFDLILYRLCFYFIASQSFANFQKLHLVDEFD